MNRQTSLKKQQGAVLIVSLLIMLIMTLISVAGLRTTTLEEKMVTNIRDKNIAFEAAEAALQEAEGVVEAEISMAAYDTTGTDGKYDNTIVDIEGNITWVAGTDCAASADIVGTYTNTAPCYAIQNYASVVQGTDVLNQGNYGGNTGAGTLEMFRITARGTGASDNTQVILQTVYGKLL